MYNYNQEQMHAPQQQQQQTVVVVQQPMSTMNAGGQPQNVRDWSTGLCGCFEDCCICNVLLLPFKSCFNNTHSRPI